MDGFKQEVLSGYLDLDSKYIFRVNNGNTRTMCGIYSKLTIKDTQNDVSDAVLRSLHYFWTDFTHVSHGVSSGVDH